MRTVCEQQSSCPRISWGGKNCVWELKEAVKLLSKNCSKVGSWYFVPIIEDICLWIRIRKAPSGPAHWSAVKMLNSDPAHAAWHQRSGLRASTVPLSMGRWRSLFYLSISSSWCIGSDTSCFPPRGSSRVVIGCWVFKTGSRPPSGGSRNNDRVSEWSFYLASSNGEKIENIKNIKVVTVL